MYVCVFFFLRLPPLFWRLVSFILVLLKKTFGSLDSGIAVHTYIGTQM